MVRRANFQTKINMQPEDLELLQDPEVKALAEGDNPNIDLPVSAGCPAYEMSTSSLGHLLSRRPRRTTIHIKVTCGLTTSLYPPHL